MSDSTKTIPINDLVAKIRQPNHLASRIEKQAAAGAAIPKHLLHRYHHLQYHTQLVRQAWAGLLPNEILSACQVVNVSSVEITLAMSSPTAANHARYMMESCVQALRAYDQRFCQLQSIKLIVSSKTTSPKLVQSDARPDNLTKILSENTRQMITQTAQFVTQNERLNQALTQLARTNTDSKK